MLTRLAPLALIAVLIGGGWSMIAGLLPPEVRRVAESIGSRVRSGAQQAFPSAPTQTGYYPPPAGQPPGYPQAHTGYAAPQPTYGQPAYGQTTPSIRIGSFNIQTFGDAKARKPYVMQAIASIVRMFDVIAIQEIRTQDDYFVENVLRNYVNADGRSRYAARVSPRLGRTTSTERYAFLYNTATIESHPGVDFVLSDPEDRLHREPHVAWFRTKLAPPQQAFTFLLMNVHTDPDDARDEMDSLYGAYQAVQRMSIGGASEDDVILLGDLNTNVPIASGGFSGVGGRALTPADLGRLASLPGIYPLVRNEPTNTRGSRLHDNLLVSRVATTEFTGAAGVYDFRRQWGLTEQQALELSDHLPVWGEFSAYESRKVGVVAQR